jgi:outer membrane biosynthesis protein TonB
MAPKAPSKPGKKAAEKTEKKGKAAAAQPQPEELENKVDLEELEEQQEEAAAAASSSGAAAMAAAAAGAPTEMSTSFKNFRHHPDMENFYRFIYDNDLRHEALAIIEEIMVDKQAAKQLKTQKSNAH